MVFVGLRLRVIVGFVVVLPITMVIVQEMIDYIKTQRLGQRVFLLPNGKVHILVVQGQIWDRGDGRLYEP